MSTVLPATHSDRRQYYRAKRALDILVSATLLILLAPLMLLIALIVKLDTRGPALFAQERVTARLRYRDGKPVWERRRFRIYKFRSMVQHADPALHRAYIEASIRRDEQAMARLEGGASAVRKLARDPRITRVGHVLRKTSLDELPQLWNVLAGEISLVGPRPAIPYEVDMYKSWYHRRLEAVPGITGWWQVTARSKASFEEMVELDIWYVEHQSLSLDLRILLRTPLVVLFARDAA